MRKSLLCLLFAAMTTAIAAHAMNRALAFAQGAGARQSEPDSQREKGTPNKQKGAANAFGRNLKGKEKEPDAQKLKAAEKNSNKKVKLSRADQKTLAAAVSAQAIGDQMAVLKTVSPWVAKAPPVKLAEMEKGLTLQGLPNLGKLLADARLAIADQGYLAQSPKLSAGEAVLILPALDEQVRGLIATNGDVTKSPDIALLKTLDQCEDRLWKLHVRRNRIESSRRIVELMRQIRNSVPKGKIAKLAESQKQLFSADSNTLSNDLESALQTTNEQDLLVRLHRMRIANKVLQGPQLTAEKFYAAYTWRLDQSRLLDGLPDSSGKTATRFKDPALNAEGLTSQVQAIAAECERLAGDLAPKAFWLFEGMHWWLRGRYGAGPEVWGLAKSESALLSHEGLFPLFMPEVPPTPTPFGASLMSAAQVPVFERRHHYWWAWEDRGVTTETFGYTTTDTSHSGWCKNGYFW